MLHHVYGCILPGQNHDLLTANKLFVMWQCSSIWERE